MKILITGAAGFIASNIADAYINLGHEVVIIDNLSSGKTAYLNPKAKFYKEDIRARKNIETILNNEKPDIINHHAAQMSVRISVADPVFDAEVNIMGFLNLLEAGKTNGVKKIIFASSGGVVYGDAGIIPTPETYDPKTPLSPYGISKLASEYYLNFYFKTYSIPYIALRYSNVYGPRQNPHGEAGVVAIFSQKLLAGEKPTVNGKGQQTRDYVFVEDVVAANVRALTSNYIGGVNIGTRKETTVLQIFAGIEKQIKSGLTPIFGDAKKGEQARSCLNNELAKKVLDWSPVFNLEEGLAKTVSFFRKQKYGN